MDFRLPRGALLLLLALPVAAKDGDPYGGFVTDEFLSKITERKTAPGAQTAPVKPGAVPTRPTDGSGRGTGATAGADGTGGAPGASNSGPEAASPEAAARASAEGAARSRGASASAARAARLLKAGALGDPGSAGPGGSALDRGRAGAAAGPEAAGTADGKRLLIASASGQGAVFKDLGLKTVVGPDGRVGVVDSSGQPASAAEMALLNERLATEPTALIRRPDFYRVIPRDRFQELKGDYRERLDLRGTSFKDMGLTPAERDFQWAASCQKLSGDCNPVESAQHYTKGDLVAPETLEKTWETVHPPAPEDAEEAALHADQDARRLKRLRAYRARRRARGLAGTFASLRSRLDRLFGRDGEDSESDRSGLPGTGPGLARVVPEPGPESGRVSGTATGPRVPGAPPSPSPGSAPKGGLASALSASLAAVAAVLFWLRRRQDGSKGEPS